MPPVVVWIVLGLVSGVVAKLLMPGKDKGGLITTTLIGIAGSVLGGFVGRQLGLATSEGGLTVLDFATAVGGALVLLLLFRVLKVVF
jgi:uncharacterized membrane protein YeaQ/YmgE (transglycosylase-associated protein family)